MNFISIALLAATLTSLVRTEAYMAKAVEQSPKSPAALMQFVADIPKGGDLHHHLSSSVYAESYITYAVEDGDCIDSTYTIVPPPCDAAAGSYSATRAQTDYAFRNRTIDAFSMRNYVPVPSDGSPLAHFFSAFARFNLPVNRHVPEELAEVVHRAAVQHEIYLETMLTPDLGASTRLGRQNGWDDNFDRMRNKLDAAGIAGLVAMSRANLDADFSQMRKLLHCGSSDRDIGCSLTVRVLYPIQRVNSPEEVFAQIQTAFELASVDRRVVGVNPVAPQDDNRALADFSLHMRMFAYFHHLYPNVHITMHAGELFPGLVPPEAMLSPAHIRDSIEIGGAERIGHGTDVSYEPDSRQLLALMARRHILVEDTIYVQEMVFAKVPGGDVLRTYLDAGVPVSLGTDDEGIARSDLSETFLRAIEAYGVDYYTLKKMIRDSLQHAFIAGPDLWRAPEAFGTMVQPCSGDRSTLVPASRSCRDYLAKSPKAAIEWNEEAALTAFESRF